MTPEQATAMPGKWTLLATVLNNKKAMDEAFRQHRYNMQRDEANKAAQLANTRLQGTFRLAEQSMQNKQKNSPEVQAQQATMKWAQTEMLDLNNPDDQAKAQQVYQYFLNQLSGKSQPASPEPNTLSGVMTGLRMGAQGTAGDMATGGIPPPRPSIQPEPVASVRPAAPAAPTAQPGTVPTAVNPKTGKRLYYRNGKWVNK